MINNEMGENQVQPIDVCFVSLAAYPLFNPHCEVTHGGAAVDLYMIGTELAKDNRFRVTFITGNFGQPPVEMIDGIRLIRCNGLQKNILLAGLSLWRAMRLADCDVYFRKLTTLPTFLVALYCRLYGKYFFYRSSHTDDCDGTFIRKHWLRGRLFKWAVKKATCAFVQNRSDQDDLKRTIGAGSVYIPNAHLLSNFSQQERDCILWVGRAVEFKRPELFVSLAREFRNEKFLMICSDSGNGNNYRNIAIPQADNIEFHEYVPFAEIDRYFQRAKFLVNTSDSEGFSNTFIQACKCGTPILSLEVDPDGFLEKYNCGLCANGSWDTFVKQAKVLLEPEKQQEYGRNGRKYVETHHNIKTIIEQYKAHLTKLYYDR